MISSTTYRHAVRLTAILAALSAGWSAVAARIEVSQVEFIIAEDEVIDDDLVIVAPNVRVFGRVTGDLIAVAPGIWVSGIVEGDLIGLGIQLVTIDGEVWGDVNVASATVTVNGELGGDIRMFANHGRIRGPVAGDVLATGGQLLIAGPIEGGVYVASDSLTIEAPISGDVLARIDNIEVGEEGRIGGPLRYNAPEPIDFPEGFASEINYTKRAKPNWFIRFFGFTVSMALRLAGFALVGWLVMRVAPRFLGEAANHLGSNPARAGLVGLLVTAGFTFAPVALALAACGMTVFFGFGGLFAVLGVVVGGLLLAWNLSPLITGLWLGRWITRRGNRGVTDLRAMLVGALILGFLSGIPYLGYAFSVFSLFFAVGGVVHALSRMELRTQSETGDLVMPAPRRS